MQRVERVEDLDIFALRTQGIVSADGFTRMFTAWCPVEEYPQMVRAGFPVESRSSCPCESSVVFSE